MLKSSYIFPMFFFLFIYLVMFVYTTLFHLPFLITHLVYHLLPFTVSGYPFGIPPSSIYPIYTKNMYIIYKWMLKSSYIFPMFFFLFIYLVMFVYLFIISFLLLTVSGYPFGIPPSFIYRFWLPIWYTTLFHLPFLITHLVYHTKWVTRNGKWKRVVQYKSKEKRTNNTNYTENYRLNNTNPTNSWLDMIFVGFVLFYL
jgi:hypothetical protein